MNDSNSIDRSGQCRNNQPLPKSLSLKIGVMDGAGQDIWGTLEILSWEVKNREKSILENPCMDFLRQK